VFGLPGTHALTLIHSFLFPFTLAYLSLIVLELTGHENAAIKTLLDRLDNWTPKRNNKI
jgi:hypothetical protein